MRRAVGRYIVFFVIAIAAGAALITAHPHFDRFRTNDPDLNCVGRR